MLDLQKINESQALVNQIETLLVELEGNIQKAAPDILSAIETKKIVINLLTGLNVVKQDLEKYKNGKSLKTEKEEEQQATEIVKQLFLKYYKNKKKNNNDDDGMGGLPNFGDLDFK